MALLLVWCKFHPLDGSVRIGCIDTVVVVVVPFRLCFGENSKLNFKFAGSKMLSSMLKEHQLKQIKKREDIEQKRKEAINSSVKFTSQMVHHLNEGVAQTYLNQRKLDNEAKQLYGNIEQFSRSTNQWLKLMNNFNDSLKQLGDVENWARVIENDMKEISSILEYVYNSNQQQQDVPTSTTTT